MRRLLEFWRRRLPGRRTRSLIRPASRSAPRSRADARLPGSHRRVRKVPPRPEQRPGTVQPPGGGRWPGEAPPAVPGQWPGTTQPARPGQWQATTQPARPGQWQATTPPARPGQWPAGKAAARALSDAQAAATVRAKTAPTAQREAAVEAKAAIPWYERAQRTSSAPGQRHCGVLEKILHRQWAASQLPPPQIVLAIDRLAEFPQLIKQRLVAGLDAIYVGPGAVPDLDDMGSLSGKPLPSGRATWDACAGAYGEGKVIVGSRPSPTSDVMCHEVGHALDDIDGADGSWQSDSVDFARLYDQCMPWMTTDFHRQPGHLGRREFFADAFAAIASSQRPALLEMLGGNTRAALNVMLYFNVRYGI
jgi:hypothetical protein